MRWISSVLRAPLPTTSLCVLALALCCAEFAQAAWAASQAPAQSIALPQPPTPIQPPPSRFVVVLDAAHGGDDSGARLDGDQLEKSFALAFSVRLRSLLNARGIQVVTTRDQDIAIDPDRRAAIANHAQAQACLSLHASQSGQGVHLYVSSLQPEQPSRFAAWKTAQSAFVSRSLTLAGVLNGALVHAQIKVLAGRVGLPGLDSMTCPAVAIEVAPETADPGSAAPASAAGGLADPDYQARVAAAIAAAMLEWRSEGRLP